MTRDLVAAYAAHLTDVRHRQSRTVERYARVLRRLERELIIPFTDATADDLLGFLLERANGGNAPASWNARVTAIKGFYSWLKAEGLVRRDPSLVLERQRQRVQEKAPLTFAELIALVDAARSSQPRYRARNVALMLTLIHTGLRVTELVSLNVDQVDLDGHRFLGVLTKGGKELALQFNDVVHEALAELLEGREQDGSEPAPLFISDRGSRLAVRSVQAFVRRYAKKAGITRQVTPHLLRHSYASGLAEIGIPMMTIQKALGHESIKTTERYVHVDLQHRRRATEAFGAHWRQSYRRSPPTGA